jgi:peptidoglycan/xylan/chitin deacetylase (PgdA/CDA1 family)
MEYLAENCKIISTNHLIQHLLENREFEVNCVAVTFDGGYSDIYYTAKEVLENYQIPATVFAYSANITGEGEKFWWDEIEDLIIANNDKRNLNIRIGDDEYNFSLTNQKDRFYTFEKLYELLRKMSAKQQKQVIEQIKEQVEFNTDEADEHRLMDKDEIFELSRNPLFTIGAHGHSGASICAANSENNFNEIIENKQVLEQITGDKIECFSYPYRFQANHRQRKEIEQILKGCGIKAAFGHDFGTVTPEMNCIFDIPRVKAGNYHPYVFFQLFENFFE